MQPALLLGADVSEALVDDVQLLSLPSRMLAACVAIVSVWWGALNVVTLRNLRPRPASQERPPGVSLLAAAASQLRATLAAAVAPANANAFRFLVALLFSSAGNAAVLAVTPAVLVDEIRLTSAQVSVVLLCVQLAGIAGAALYHRLGACAGLRAAYALVLLQWLLGPQAIFLLETEDDLPLVLGVGVYLGVALGGYIALGRALYAGLLVRGKEAQFMGLFVFATQLLSWLGTLTFTVINESTRNVRFAYAFLSVFFAIALLLFSRVRAPDPAAQVEPDAPIEPRRVGAEEDEEQPEDDPKGKAVELAASKA
jgi:UMF1 family MFS transporter